MKFFNVIIISIYIFTWTCTTPVLAEDLSFDGGGDGSVSSGNQQGGSTAPSQSSLVPVSYGTSYDPQFSGYASFMQQPYGSTGALQQQYTNSSFPASPQISMDPNIGGSKDPLTASEVSPYSHYSPYIEVIGEGSNYTLGVDDVVTIIVRNQPDFSGRFIVDPEGNIQYNFVGDIKAAGKKKEEVKAEIIEKLQRFVRYPEVAVMISEYRSKAIFVFGFVNRPGKYAMKGDKISVKEAIVAAGLPREDGSMKRVYVVRPSNYTADGKPTSKKVNLKDLIIKGIAAEDFVLESGDTIVVHQKYFDRFVNGFSRLVGPVFQAAAVYELAYGNKDGFLH